MTIPVYLGACHLCNRPVTAPPGEPAPQAVRVTAAGVAGAVLVCGACYRGLPVAATVRAGEP